MTETPPLGQGTEMASQVVAPEKRYRMSLLLDAYGELLTEKQRTFMRRYYEEDLSFGEIAREFDISRQAIFDAVKHGEGSLAKYESALGIVGGGGGKARPGGQAGKGASEALLGRADQLERLGEQIAESSVDSDVTWITTELDEVAGALRGEAAKMAGPGEGSEEDEAEEKTAAKPESRSRSLIRGDGLDFD